MALSVTRRIITGYTEKLEIGTIMKCHAKNKEGGARYFPDMQEKAESGSITYIVYDIPNPERGL